MKKIHTKQFATLEEALSYLEKRGTLEYFGRNGRNAEQYIFLLHLPNGRTYDVTVYDNGKVETWE